MRGQTIWGLLRLALGWIFLWAFIDKVWGLGFTTKPEGAWLHGGSPTSGFLQFGTKGPFAEIFKNLAGSGIVDWLFMLGLLFVGVTLILGIFVRLGGYVGVLILILMYVAGFLPPEHNPFVDEHIVYALIMAGLTVTHAGGYLGFGGAWRNTNLVRKFPIFE